MQNDGQFLYISQEFRTQMPNRNQEPTENSEKFWFWNVMTSGFIIGDQFKKYKFLFGLSILSESSACYN